MIEKINAAIKEAMKNQEKFRLEVLRMLKSKILVVNARGDIPDAEVVKIIQKYAKSLKETLVQQQEFNRSEEVADTEKELAVVAEFLPPELSDEELETLVKESITALGASSMKDMGNVMKAVISQQSGIDGGKVKNVVVRFLQG